MEQLDRQPAPDVSPMAQTPPTQQTPLAPNGVLAEQLAQCHKAIAECFVCGSDPRLPMLEQLESLNVAERLIRVSIALAQALGKSSREFTHRIIVERPMIDVTPDVTSTPHPLRGSRKQPRHENVVE